MSSTAPGTGELTGSVARAVLARVTERAAEWFPEVGPRPDVRLHPLVDRPRAALWAVYVGDDDARPRVLAKVRKGWAGSDGGVFGGDRPRLSRTFLPATEAVALEYRGLCDMHAMVDPADPDFGTVRPLDHLVEENTILMEHVAGNTLRQLLVRESRLPVVRGKQGGRTAEDVWRRAGSWLHRFQQHVPSAHLPTRQATRDDVVALMLAHDDFLVRRLGRRSAGDAGLRGAELAAEALPERLALTVNHGDYAPRNLFRLSDGRLAAFDPMPRWAAPRLEDLCRFLVGVSLLGLQVHSHGAALRDSDVQRIQAAVVAGYRAGGDVPEAELRCFQLLMTLDTWSAMVDSPAGGWRGRLRSASVRSASGYLRRESRRVLEPTGS